MSYYVPGHLPKRIDEYRKRLKNLSVTFIQFSPDGSELLVNLGGEQLYSFVLNGDYSQNRGFSLRHDSFRDLLANAPEPAADENATESTQQADTSASTSSSTSATGEAESSSKNGSSKYALGILRFL
jgi:hypothetical protein